MKHGIYIQEQPTAVQPNFQTDSICAVIGTAPVVNNKPTLCNSLSEFSKAFGYSDDFKNYTLCEAAKTFFSVYNIAPVVFVNVLSDKHSKEIEQEFEGQNVIRIEGEIFKDSFAVTSGEYIPPNNFTADDFEITEQTETIDDTTRTFKILTITNTEKVVDGKIDFSYRKLSTALGGDPVSEEITLSGNSFELPEDIVVESIEIESGGVDTLVDVPFEVTTDSTGATIITITDEDAAVDDKIKIRYLEIDTGKVTAADIIGGTSAATGEKTGLELVDGILPKWNLNPGVIIAPKYSNDSEVAAAMAAKAEKVNAIAVNDIIAPTYTAAIENKSVRSPYLITCWSKVTLGEQEYFLSTHLAALMLQVDYENDGVPYQSPSNKTLNIDGTINADGNEIFLSQDEGNLLNDNGIVTAISYGGSFKAWGNMLSAFPAGQDVKEIFISVRRMTDYIKNQIARNYISRLDVPITRRAIDSIVMSANLWLASLTSRGFLIGGELTFDETENPVSDLLAGRICFSLRFASPTPAQEIIFKLQFDASYFSNLFS